MLRWDGVHKQQRMLAICDAGLKVASISLVTAKPWVLLLSVPSLPPTRAVRATPIMTAPGLQTTMQQDFKIVATD